MNNATMFNKKNASMRPMCARWTLPSAQIKIRPGFCPLIMCVTGQAPFIKYFGAVRMMLFIANKSATAILL